MSFTGKRVGKLIVFEGIDGTGKSTHIGLLKDFLEPMVGEVITDFEPTRGFWGVKAREAAQSGHLSVEEEIDLFLKDRQEHVETVIAPALERGAWVLLDRYYLSMMAYQGSHGVDVQMIRDLNEAFAPIPDLVIWLDIPVSTALERIGKRGERDAFETESGLTACRNIFSSVKEEWMAQIDADESRDIVAQRVRDSIRQRFFEVNEGRGNIDFPGE